MLKIISGILFVALIIPPRQGYSQYVFYKGDTVNVKYPHTPDNFSKPVSEKITVLVSFADHPEWNFSVRLHDTRLPEPVSFASVKEIFAVSDIEGEFEAFRKLLISNKVIDEQYNWKFGKGHLVICGDLFDRGEHVTEYLWLLYKLEQDARARGGYVHVLLGNHDIMNLDGDFRYVQPKYFDDAKAMGVEYKDLFTAETELGRWLRTKNIMEKIGDILYMHAGLSQEVNALQYDLNKINAVSREFYGALYTAIPDSLKLLFNDSSPFWYRGYFTAPPAGMDQVDSTLDFYKVKKIIVGHTILDQITPVYDGKIIGIDVNEHEGRHEALLIRNKRYYRVNEKAVQTEL